MEEYLALQQKYNNQKNALKTTRVRPPKTDGQIILAALKEKFKPVVNKLTNGIPNRLKRGWKRSFGTRRHFSENDLDDTYYYEDEVGDENSEHIYDYYEEEKKKALSVPYYVTDDIIVFPKSKISTSPVPKNRIKNRIAEKTKDYNYDYNYDYVDGNYPRRIPTTKKTKHDKKKFDTSRFYK